MSYRNLKKLFCAVLICFTAISMFQVKDAMELIGEMYEAYKFILSSVTRHYFFCRSEKM